MSETLEIFGREYTDVTGIKAKDDNGNLVTFIKPEGTLNVSQNGMVDVSQYASANVNVSGGGGPEPDIPNDYQEVEYIDFTPHAGYAVTIPSNALFVCVASFSAAPTSAESTSARTILGYRTQTSSSLDFAVEWIYNTGLTAWLRSGNISKSGEVASPTIDTKYTISFATTGLRTNAFIGRYATYNSVSYVGMAGKIYSIKAYDIVTRNILAKFVPCYRKSDNTIGFCEAVSGTFYSTLSAQGGGSVTAGPDVN